MRVFQIAEYFPEIASWDMKIIGSDISRGVVDYARRGRYRRLEINRGLPERMLLKYLINDGEEWEVAPRIRVMCGTRTCVSPDADAGVRPGNAEKRSAVLFAAG